MLYRNNTDSVNLSPAENAVAPAPTPAFPVSLVEQAALLATAYGWHVFPIGKSKRPILNAESTGTRWGCSLDPQTIRKHFHQASRSVKGIGIATEESGLFVVDIDTIEGGHADDGFAAFFKLEDQHGQTPDTVTARSPSGSIHLYFKLVRGLQQSSSKVAPGVDIKASGSFVVAPPTRTPKGVYEWIHSPADTEVADAPRWLVFKAMFHGANYSKYLAAIGILDHTDLADIDVDDWREHVDGLIADHKAKNPQRSPSSAISASMSDGLSAPLNRSQASNLEALPWQLLDDIVARVGSLPPGEGNNKNTALHKAANRAGHLVGHPFFANSGITADSIEDRLMRASEGWGERHDSTSRFDSIRRGVEYGKSKASSETIKWLEKAIDRALGKTSEPLADEDNTPAVNDIERVTADEGRQQLCDQVAAAFDQVAAYQRGDVTQPPFASIGAQITANTGLGKTEAVIGAIKEHLPEITLGGGLLYFAKTLRVGPESSSF